MGSNTHYKLLPKLFVVVCITCRCSICLAESYEEVVLADKPFAYYRFNELSGATAVDATGNGRNAAYKGALQLGAAAAHPSLGTAVEFGGENARVHIVPDQKFKFGTGDLSIEFWFNCRETVASRGDILSFKGEGKDFALFKPVGNGNLLAFAKPGRAFQSQSDPVSLNAWHHAVYVRWANVDQWYIDGELSGTATGHVMLIDMNAHILIGANHLGDLNVMDEYCLWNGLLDEMAFYDFALAAERVQAHYRAATEKTAR